MPKFISLLLLQLSCCALPAQHFTLANEAQNIFYVWVDNPLSITVENVPNDLLVVKTDNGKISRDGDRYIYHANTTGRANIFLYKRIKGKLKKIGQSEFRVKSFPLPIFKIAGYGNNASVKKIIIKSQQYVRAELENFGIDASYQIDSFKVCIISGDTCQYNLKTNISNKISEELTAAFDHTKPGDTIIFKEIFAKGPDGIQIHLEPCILFVKEE